MLRALIRKIPVVHRPAPFLRHLLQDCLRIVEKPAVFIVRQDPFQDELLRFLKSAVQIQRGNQRFQRVRNHSIRISSAASLHSAAHTNKAAEIDRSGNIRKCHFTDQRHAHSGEISLHTVRIFAVQKVRTEHLKDRIAQKFQPLVAVFFPKLRMFVDKGAVSQGAQKKLPVPKMITDLFF